MGEEKRSGLAIMARLGTAEIILKRGEYLSAGMYRYRDGEM
jgi:hypothetical protein